MAAEGVIFLNQYVSSPVCTPSRYSVLTGTYASRSPDFAKDRSETHDISASHRDVIQNLRRVWEDWRQDIGILHKD